MVFWTKKIFEPLLFFNKYVNMIEVTMQLKVKSHVVKLLITWRMFPEESWVITNEFLIKIGIRFKLHMKICLWIQARKKPFISFCMLVIARKILCLSQHLLMFLKLTHGIILKIILSIIISFLNKTILLLLCPENSIAVTELFLKISGWNKLWTYPKIFGQEPEIFITSIIVMERNKLAGIINLKVILLF